MAASSSPWLILKTHMFIDPASWDERIVIPAIVGGSTVATGRSGGSMSLISHPSGMIPRSAFRSNRITETASSVATYRIAIYPVVWRRIDGALNFAASWNTSAMRFLWRPEATGIVYRLGKVTGKLETEEAGP